MSTDYNHENIAVNRFIDATLAGGPAKTPTDTNTFNDAEHLIVEFPTQLTGMFQFQFALVLDEDGVQLNAHLNDHAYSYAGTCEYSFRGGMDRVSTIVFEHHSSTRATTLKMTMREEKNGPFLLTHLLRLGGVSAMRFYGGAGEFVSIEEG